MATLNTRAVLQTLLDDTSDPRTKGILAKAIQELDQCAMFDNTPKLERAWFDPFVTTGDAGVIAVDRVRAIRTYLKLYPSAGLTLAKNLVDRELARFFPAGYQVV